MKIEDCQFGSIVINGKRFGSDLIIYPDERIMTCWRRRAGHRLSSEDIAALIDSQPEVIIAGTGVNGRVKPEKELLQKLRKKAIEFLPAPNHEAMERYNELSAEKRVGACFHLTC
jgi:hypothetical protein